MLDRLHTHRCATGRSGTFVELEYGNRPLKTQLPQRRQGTLKDDGTGQDPGPQDSDQDVCPAGVSAHVAGSTCDCAYYRLPLGRRAGEARRVELYE